MKRRPLRRGKDRGVPPKVRAQVRAKPCAVCRTPIIRSKHFATQVTCSRACEAVRRRAKATRPCPVCGAMFLRSQKRYTCSAPCWRVFLDRRMTHTCTQCGVVFKRNVRGWVRRKSGQYCTRECFTKWYRGDRSPMYRGGVEQGRGKGWAKRAEAIRQRDGHICQRCGKTQEEEGRKLCVDHIVPWRLFTDAEKDQANAPENLISVCGRCHSWKTAHAEQRYLRGDILDFKRYTEAIAL